MHLPGRAMGVAGEGEGLRPGLRITPSLELVRPLGAGGMGHVWVAQHHGLHTEVVVKFMAEHLAQNPDALARFTREAAAAAQVKSPHVVQTFDHGLAANGLPFIAMELLEGQTLSERIDAESPMPPAEVAGLIQQAARALLRAHERGVVHRDIKPDNIFLCESGGGEAFVKVLDFGIAKSVGPESLSMTKTGAMMGTPYYMSPEQVMARRDVDHRTDLWALGVVAFEALTGLRPFEADTVGALSVMICAGELPRPSWVRSNLGPAIDAWFARACARSIDERFGDAKTLADDLARACGGVAPVRLVRAGVSRPIPATQLTPAPMSPRIETVRMASGAGALQATTGASASTSQTQITPTVAPGPARRTLTLALAGTIVLVGVLAGSLVAVSRSSSTNTPAEPAGQPEATKKLKAPVEVATTAIATVATAESAKVESPPPTATAPPAKPKPSAVGSAFMEKPAPSSSAPPPAPPKPPATYKPPVME